MRKQLQLGLVVEGNATSSVVVRLPNVAEELGPIKSSGLQVARRVSNFLQAGYAVSGYDEMQDTRVILLRLPDGAVPRVVEELCAAELSFEELSFVLCESWLLTEVMGPLKTKGASIASLVATAGSRERRFVVEGDRLAVRQARRLLERGDVRTVELRPGTKQLYFAAALLTTALPVPIYVTAQEALRESGVSGNDLAMLLEEMSQEMFASFSKGARVTWGGPLAECLTETADEYFGRLGEDHPKLTKSLNELLSWARAHMPKNRLAKSQWA